MYRPRRLDERCASPLVLMNNVPPQFTVSRSPSPKINLEEPRESPFKYWQQTTERQQATFANQAPKRTVSLGPRRQLAFQGTLNNNNVQQEQNKPPTAAARRDSFNKAANELQTSLTQLNNLIETPKPGLPPPARLRSSRFDEVPLITKSSQNSPPNENDEPPRRWQWQEDLENWKSSSSVNDLRSMFDQKPKLNMPPLGATKPPVSASPSVLRSSPWLTSNQQVDSSTSKDYTIRRTISTSSSSAGGRQRPVLRNPYRNENWK